MCAPRVGQPLRGLWDGTGYVASGRSDRGMDDRQVRRMTYPFASAFRDEMVSDAPPFPGSPTKGRS